eukprot:312804-Chlamydomonas_euryale.AAC.4
MGSSPIPTYDFNISSGYGVGAAATHILAAHRTYRGESRLGKPCRAGSCTAEAASAVAAVPDVLDDS